MDLRPPSPLSSGELKSRMTARFPGLSTRRTSCRHRSLSSTFRRPYPIVTQSKLESSKGRSRASPWIQLIVEAPPFPPRRSKVNRKRSFETDLCSA